MAGKSDLAGILAVVSPVDYWDSSLGTRSALLELANEAWRGAQRSGPLIEGPHLEDAEKLTMAALSVEAAVIAATLGSGGKIDRSPFHFATGLGVHENGLNPKTGPLALIDRLYSQFRVRRETALDSVRTMSMVSIELGRLTETLRHMYWTWSTYLPYAYDRVLPRSSPTEAGRALLAGIIRHSEELKRTQRPDESDEAARLRSLALTAAAHEVASLHRSKWSWRPTFTAEDVDLHRRFGLEPGALDTSGVGLNPNILRTPRETIAAFAQAQREHFNRLYLEPSLGTPPDVPLSVAVARIRATWDTDKDFRPLTEWQ